MLSTIEKHLIPVIAEEIRNYKRIKIRNSYSVFCEYMRTQPPLPLIILKKFTQKYGVKALAVKNLRQILRYVEMVRNHSSRDEIIYQLLLPDNFGEMTCDNLLLYVSIEAVLDAGITSLSSFPSKLKVFEPEELQYETLLELCKPYIS